MITTKKGLTTITGTRTEIFADLYAIMMAAHDKVPDELLAAVEKFVEDCDDARSMQLDVSDNLTTDQKREALAAVISHLPKEEQERLKKQLKE